VVGDVPEVSIRQKLGSLLRRTVDAPLIKTVSFAPTQLPAVGVQNNFLN
jgi:hypothetical protein